MTTNNTEIIDAIIDSALSSKMKDKNDFQKIQNEVYKKHKLSKPLASIEILNRYSERIKNGEFKENITFKKILRKRWVRSLSWVTVISLLTKFFWCPWKCVYCPTFEWLPKSYIPNEPAVMRAELNKFDPILQVHSRLRGLEVTGHKIEKNDVRIIGGTWSFYPTEYQEDFIKWIYDAFNTYDVMREKIEETDFSRDRFAGFKLQQWYQQFKSETLEEAKKRNESSRCRVIGIAIETRPDWINKEEIIKFRRYWVTRVEIGYQTTIDEINEKNKRGHGNKESMEATKLLKDAWCKVVAHMMPNLLWSTPELDKKAMQEVFENPWFRPDELKIYPMVVTDKAELTKIWKEWWFTAYDDETLIELMCELESLIPEYVRINRTYRDIPSSEILHGSTLSNLRQIVEERLESRGIKMIDIRSREIKWKNNNPENAVLKTLEYEASWGKEYFMTFEDPEDRTIFSLLRLRIPSQYFSKEKHFIPELEGCWIIREIHTFGDQLSIWEVGSTFWQHIWFGKKLIIEAERIVKENYNLPKVAVIAWVWVRAYYEKRGYSLVWEYMIKEL